MNKPKFKAGKTFWSVLYMENNIYYTRHVIQSVKLRYSAIDGKVVTNYLILYYAEGTGVKTDSFWSPTEAIDQCMSGAFPEPKRFVGLCFGSERAALRYKAKCEEAMKLAHKERMSPYL